MVFKQAEPITSEGQLYNREAAVNQPFNLIEASSYLCLPTFDTAALQAATACCPPEANT